MTSSTNPRREMDVTSIDVERLARALPDYLLDTENGILRREPIAQQIAAAYLLLSPADAPKASADETEPLTPAEIVDLRETRRRGLFLPAEVRIDLIDRLLATVGAIDAERLAIAMHNTIQQRYDILGPDLSSPPDAEEQAAAIIAAEYLRSSDVI
jgi:hypothetical protein